MPPPSESFGKITEQFIDGVNTQPLVFDGLISEELPLKNKISATVSNSGKSKSPSIGVSSKFHQMKSQTKKASKFEDQI